MIIFQCSSVLLYCAVQNLTYFIVISVVVHKKQNDLNQILYLTY